MSKIVNVFGHINVIYGDDRIQMVCIIINDKSDDTILGVSEDYDLE